MKKFEDFLNEQLEDQEVKEEFQKLEPLYTLARDLIVLRKKRGLTQKELAEKAGTTQAVISRIESGSANCTVETLQKISAALDGVVTVQIESRQVHSLLQEWVNDPELIKPEKKVYFPNHYCEEILSPTQTPAKFFPVH